MNNIMDNFEKQKIRELTAKKNIPNFRDGDTIKVNVKVLLSRLNKKRKKERIFSYTIFATTVLVLGVLGIFISL